jgi:hypothetical protein
MAEDSNRAVPAGVLAAAWRASARQPRLARALRSSITEVVAPDRAEAPAVGWLCAQSGACDVVDVSVAACARMRGQAVVTTDPDDDLSAIDGGLVPLSPG